MKITKLITGAVLVVMAVVVMFQFKFDSFIQALLGYADLGATASILLAIALLIAGAIYIICHSSTSILPPIISFIIVTLGGIMGIFNATRFPGLMLWSWAGIVIGLIMAIVTIVLDYFFEPAVDQYGNAQSNSYYDNNSNQYPNPQPNNYNAPYNSTPNPPTPTGQPTNNYAYNSNMPPNSSYGSQPPYPGQQPVTNPNSTTPPAAPSNYNNYPAANPQTPQPNASTPNIPNNNYPNVPNNNHNYPNNNVSPNPNYSAPNNQTYYSPQQANNQPVPPAYPNPQPPINSGAQPSVPTPNNNSYPSNNYQNPQNYSPNPASRPQPRKRQFKAGEQGRVTNNYRYNSKG
ncbi:hypothetical protein [Bombilactobacillus bombi]|uniref:hypothetical protein n=1 Tax=Bombilactobacillus bombi TaxID=1303590 RepID=UPI0015E61F26|nr:hypothetical protein [Bombilactobacillus bombi]MBA1433783.1 hypothetical protein [Bombilactobacillus bombi]